MAGANCKILGECRCGMILMRDGSEESWTMMQSVLKLAMEIKKNGKINQVNCPGCGGDKAIPIGDYYHPAFLNKTG